MVKRKNKLKNYFKKISYKENLEIEAEKLMSKFLQIPIELSASMLIKILRENEEIKNMVYKEVYSDREELEDLA